MTPINNTAVIPTSVLQYYSKNRAATVLEVNPFSKWKPEWNNFSVEAMEHIKRKFGKYGPDTSLINDIFQYEGTSTSNVNSRYFILTEQVDSFEKIKPSAVLGAVKTTNMADDGVFVDMLQINPWYAFTTPRDTFSRTSNPQYRHCGTSMINALKEIFANKDLFAHVPLDLVECFEHFGFKTVDMSANKGDVLMKCSGLLR